MRLETNQSKIRKDTHYAVTFNKIQTELNMGLSRLNRIKIFNTSQKFLYKDGTSIMFIIYNPNRHDPLIQDIWHQVP